MLGILGGGVAKNGEGGVGCQKKNSDSRSIGGSVMLEKPSTI
jgi:hypothetical protein